MSLASRHFKDKVTVWTNSGSDGFGGFTFLKPVLFKCRYEDRQALFITDTGEEKVSSAMVFLAEDVLIGDYVAEGDFTSATDPTSIRNAKTVRQVQKETDLRSLNATRKLFL